MKYVNSLSVCFFLFLRVHGAATELSSFIDHGNPWQATPSFFMNIVNQPGSARSFDWVSADTRNQARFPSYANSPELALWGMKVWEALASFETNLTELKISIYNRGDAEARNERVIRGADAMAALLRQIDGRMVNWAGAKGRDDTDRSLSSAGADMKRRHYYKGKMHYGCLEWSYSGRTSSDRQLEYATVYFEPLTRDNDMRLLHNRSRQQEFTRPTAKSLVEKVMRTPQGDVYIDGIPMVNQGQRSFCSAATVERILRHYGHDVDQHVIAQLAQSSGSAGTDGNALREALKKASSKLGVKMKPLYQMAVTVKDWQELAKDYNRSAKRKGLPEVPDSQWISRQGRMTNFATGRLVDAFNWDVYKEYRLERLSALSVRYKAPHRYWGSLDLVRNFGPRRRAGAATDWWPPHASDHRLQCQGPPADLF